MVACDYLGWLGISYNTLASAYTWTDGWPITLDYFPLNNVLGEKSSFTYLAGGTQDWLLSTLAYASCQVRTIGRVVICYSSTGEGTHSEIFISAQPITRQPLC